jgi:periplasmic protein TonB
MYRLRFLFAAALGGAVTLALLVLMHSLIATGERALDESTPIRIADVTMGGTRSESGLVARMPDRIEEPERPPPAVALPEAQDFATAGELVVNMAAAPAPELQIGTGLDAAATDSEYLPIVKVAAVYPRQAQARGITGYCIVEYTVTTSGATRDPVPVDCSPPGVFEQSAVKAAQKFKYRPRVIDGRPVEVAGVRNRFLYELDQ